MRLSELFYESFISVIFPYLNEFINKLMNRKEVYDFVLHDSFDSKGNPQMGLAGSDISIKNQVFLVLKEIQVCYRINR